jgi:hypothetical protein
MAPEIHAVKIDGTIIFEPTAGEMYLLEKLPLTPLGYRITPVRGKAEMTLKGMV